MSMWTGMGPDQPAPRLDPKCQCICHTQPGVMHVAACCSAPTPSSTEAHFTPSDLRAAADREDDPALAAMLRQGADDREEVERLRKLIRRVIDDPHWRTCDNTLWPDLCDAVLPAEARLAALTEKQE